MSRGREILVRAGLTAAVLGLFVGALAASGYPWNFRPLWAYRNLYLEGLEKTLLATLVGFLTGLAVGVAAALARLSRTLPIRHLGDLYVEVIRGTPFLVQILVAYFCVAPLLGLESRFWVGTVALGIFSGAYIGEVLRAGIESVERGQFEAARSLGLSRTQTMRHVVFPQAAKRMIPPLTGELIALTKESSLLYVISFMELSFAAKQISSKTTRGFEAYLVVAAMYLTITVPLSMLARRLERRLAKSARPGIDL
jgi:polar amino acid transport system permease protein